MKVSILGTGAYGIALASIINNNGYDISCYTKFEEEKNELLKTRKQKGLGEYLIPESIEITTDIKECLEDTELIVLALPSSFSESILEEVVKLSDKPILIATKGILDDGRFLSEVLEDLGRDNYGVISGPSFAIDIVNGDTIGLSLATKTLELKEFFKKVFMNEKVKIRSTKDVIGVELCGTLKNIFAIESGILTGLGTSDSTRAMFLTESIGDMRELLKDFGCEEETVMSFSGFGDLLLTCTSTKSRNFSFGNLVGSKISKKEKEEYLKKSTVEGYVASKIIYNLIKKKNINVDVLELIYNILYNDLNPEVLLTFLVIK